MVRRQDVEAFEPMTGPRGGRPLGFSPQPKPPTTASEVQQARLAEDERRAAERGLKRAARRAQSRRGSPMIPS